MKHHAKEEARESLDFIYYLVGLGSGLFTGAVIDKGLAWIVAGGVLGLLTAAFFLNVMVKDRRNG